MLRLVHYPPGHHQPKHVHGEVSLSLLLDGGLIERVGRREVSARPGQWCHKAAGVDHATSFGPVGASTLQLVVPELSALRPGLSWRWGFDAPVTQLMWSLLGARPAASGGEWLDDLAALLAPPEEDHRVPPWWPRAHEALCDASVSIASIAADCGVHRAQLVRVTQRLAGCSPTVLRQRARLGRCLARLSSEPDLALSQVALTAGFADQAHFSRACRHWLGQAPGRWRRTWLAPHATTPVPSCAGR